jgi:hypothetical protein
MVENGNDEWQGTEMMNSREQPRMGNDEQWGTGMTNGVVMSGSTPPSLQM